MSNKNIILIVEDEVGSVKLLQNRLEAHGYEVIVAYNGKEALEKWRENLLVRYGDILPIMLD